MVLRGFWRIWVWVWDLGGDWDFGIEGGRAEPIGISTAIGIGVELAIGEGSARPLDNGSSMVTSLLSVKSSLAVGILTVQEWEGWNWVGWKTSLAGFGRLLLWLHELKRSLGEAPVSVIAVLSLLVGLIFGFVALPLFALHEISINRSINKTWKHYLTSLEKVALTTYSGIRRAVANSSLSANA